MAKVVEVKCLPTVVKPRVVGSALRKLSMADHACYPNTGEEKAGESGVQGYSWLYSKLEATLGYMKSHHKNELINKE